MKVRVDTGGTLPTRAHRGDAGWDLYAPKAFSIAPTCISERLDLKVGFEIPYGHVGLVKERSSQGRVGVFSIGQVVDHGYTGNVHVTLVNNGDATAHYSAGDRVAQLIVLPIANIEALEQVETFEETERGDKAHGSSGK